MNKSLGLAFLIAGLLSFYQTYLVLWSRDALWEDENQEHHSQEQLPQHTPAWERGQQLKAPW